MSVVTVRKIGRGQRSTVIVECDNVFIRMSQDEARTLVNDLSKVVLMPTKPTK